MVLKKAVNLLAALVFLLGFSVAESWAQEAFVTIVNPVRGGYAWGGKAGTPLRGVELQKKILGDLPVTWLLRFDALSDPELVSSFKNGSNHQELGLFLEVTPGLADLAGVSYPSAGIFWHDANKIFLSGYRPADRKKIIDTLFDRFKESFGYYPKSVGAWHIDAFSAEYMKSRFAISGVLICADQFGTDGYQIWGGWWGVPFYPSRYNILSPAQSLANKLGVVVFWWAARDPALGYGGSVEESTYSVQVNDYQQHGFDVAYFSRLADAYLKDPSNQFGQLTIGLENDSNWEKIGDGFEKQIREVEGRRELGEIRLVTLSAFADWYFRQFPALSPPHQVGEWRMTPAYRLGWLEANNQRYVRDLRIYNEQWPEANLSTANPWETLALNNPAKVDSVRFPDKQIPVSDQVDFSGFVTQFGTQEIPFQTNQVSWGLWWLAVVLLTTVGLRQDWSKLWLVLLGSLSLSLPLVKSGLVYRFGMGFWGPNGHDGIWHLAVINQLSRWSWENPLFSGELFKNYHFGFDLLVAFLHRLTTVPVVNLYFQVLPPIMAVLIGVLTHRFVNLLTGSRTKAWWATFFVYFGGSWGWLVNLFRHGQWGGESMFWANQAVSSLVNPPFALSLLFLLWGLINFEGYLKAQKRKHLWLAVLFFGILISVKVYAGVIILGALLLGLVFSFARHQPHSKPLAKIFTGSLVLACLLFFPFNRDASSLLTWSPLWFPHTMLAFGDRLGWFKLENARLAYFQSGNWLKWLVAEGLALTIFVLGNLGTRLLGLGRIKRLVGRGETGQLLLSATVVSLVLPLVFIQKGNPWNTIQFFYYFQFFLAILAGWLVGGLWESRQARLGKYSLTVLLAALTLPTTISTLKDSYLPLTPPARISVEELEALSFLKKQPLGVVLAYPYNRDWFAKFSEPRPLYAYETTGYLSALSTQPVYLADEMNLEISGYDWRARREESWRFFYSADSGWASRFLAENEIKYIYLVKGQKLNLGLGDINGEKIFENGEVVIYRLN